MLWQGLCRKCYNGLAFFARLNGYLIKRESSKGVKPKERSKKSKAK
jgi:hypothetical protein